MKMSFHETSPDVFVSDTRPAMADGEIFSFLKERATASPRHRARWCAHPSNESTVHEMFIALASGVYVPPHRHFAKSESLHVLEGEGALVLFDDEGSPTRAIHLGPASSGSVFFHRLDKPIFHTVLVFSTHLVFHETIQGPFVKREPETISWAPSEMDGAAIENWVRKLHQFCDNQQ